MERRSLWSAALQSGTGITPAVHRAALENPHRENWGGSIGAGLESGAPAYQARSKQARPEPSLHVSFVATRPSGPRQFCVWVHQK